MLARAYELEEVRIGRGRSRHLVVSELHPDLSAIAARHHVGDGRPLCGRAAEHIGSPLSNARLCGPCEGMLEMLEYDIGGERYRSAAALASAEIERVVRNHESLVGW